ncbi:MAG: hypothetical protein KBC62_03955 [Candidatus Pacebacteria bacterium]|nr:hypothetical protein [Candidatus Paceibacterota bacterium]
MHKGLLISAVIILIIMGIVLTINLKGEDSKLKQTSRPVAEQTEQTVQPTQQNQDIAVEEETQTDNRIYTDSTFGFTFQYPARVGEFRVEVSDYSNDSSIKYPTKFIEFYLSTNDPQHLSKGYRDYVALHVWVAPVNQFQSLLKYCSDNSDNSDIYLNECQIIDMTDPAGENSKYVFRTQGFVSFDSLYSKPNDALTGEEFEELIQTFTTFDSE